MSSITSRQTRPRPHDSIELPFVGIGGRGPNAIFTECTGGSGKAKPEASVMRIGAQNGKGPGRNRAPWASLGVV